MLHRLRLSFSSQSPEIDESPLPGECPLALAQRLAIQKARAVYRKSPTAIVIGADQVLDFNGRPLGKPGNFQAARAQLAMLSGQAVTFHSALALVTPQWSRVRVVACQARFRALNNQQIEHYLALEQPFDTAGSAKAESLGIALLDSLASDDPTAIIGLPLIALTQLLSQAGIDPLDPHEQF